MRHFKTGILTILLTFTLHLLPVNAAIGVFFSPYENIEEQFVGLIKNAKSSIKISCFGLTNDAIYEALLERHRAGVKVLVLTDKMQSASKHDYRDSMREAGITVIVKKTGVLQHNKMLAVDGVDAIIGSWNLSNNAQRQDNSVVVFINEPEIVEKITHAMNRIYERDRP